MRNVKFVCGLLIVGACGGDAVTEGVAEVLEDAGEALADAGQAVADAGAWLDGSSARAADDAEVPTPTRRTLTAPCDRVAEQQQAQVDGELAWATLARYARVEGVELEQIRGAWVCSAQPRPALSAGEQSRGVPSYTCAAGLVLWGDGGVWVQCAEASDTVKIVID